MVLKFNNETISSKIKSIANVHNNHPGIVEQAENFKQLNVVEVSENNSLYVGQGEYAVISGNTDLPQVVGSDDATTCYITILVNATSKTCAVAHLDGRRRQDESLLDIIKQFQILDGNVTDINVYIIGGYSSSESTKAIDSKNCSQDISSKLLHIMIASEVTFSIKLWCVSDLNTKNNIVRPAITGLSINRKFMNIYSSNFTVRCPAPLLRSGFFWVEGSDSLINIYDSVLGAVIIRPFYDWEQERFAYLSKLSDSRLLTYFSTSPLVEPPSFCLRLRETFSFLGSTNSIFDKNCNKYFKLNGIGNWEEIYPKNN